jgi:23S rRNA (uracil1939-C5)-methyltransferase
MAERLCELAGDAAGLRGTERVFDFYCGIGTIGISLAKRAGEVWGVETVPEAISDAEHNASERDRQRALHRRERATRRAAAARAGRQARRGDRRPPRAGLSKKIVRRVIECGAPRIVYVSCNPTTLAPNAAQLTEAGYRLRQVTPVDMFPHTPHVECVAVLER